MHLIILKAICHYRLSQAAGFGVSSEKRTWSLTRTLRSDKHVNSVFTQTQGDCFFFFL